MTDNNHRSTAAGTAQEKKLTPMMQQYHELKRVHQDKFVFFRLGDFYELFLDDAIEGAKLLSLTLTRRGSMPMCGMPHHQLHVYTARLIAQGKKVAVVDQTEPAQEHVKLVAREVTEVLTPGTASEWRTLAAKENNYLLALSMETETLFALPRWIAAVVDVSTGEVEVQDWGSSNERLIAERVLALGVREALFSNRVMLSSVPEHVRERTKTLLLSVFDSALPENSELAQVEAELAKLYGLSSAAAFTKELRAAWNLPPAAMQQARRGNTAAAQSATATAYASYVCILAPLLRYVGKEQHRVLQHLRRPQLLRQQDTLELDAATIKNLELLRNQYDDSSAHTLLATLDETQTAMGGRLLRRFLQRPLAQEQTLVARLDRVEWFYRRPTFLNALRKQLAELQDMERLAGRIGMGKCLPKELRALTRTLFAIAASFQYFTDADAVALDTAAAQPAAATEQPFLYDAQFFWQGEGFAGLNQLLRSRKDPAEPSFATAAQLLRELAEKLERELVNEPQNDFAEGGVMQETATPRLAELYATKRQFLTQLAELLVQEKTKTGIATLKLKYTDNLGYFFEVNKSQLSAVPEYFQRKQTLVGAGRFATTELLTLEKRVRENMTELVELEKALYQQLVEFLRAQLDILQQVAAAVAYLDVYSTFAQLAIVQKYVRPVFCENTSFLYKNGRHPVIERLQQNEPFIKNSLTMDKQHSILHILTGPNMAGKSTFLRQTALIALMAQLGSFVPAEQLQLPVFDRIFTRIGTGDKLVKGESTFLVEMHETANILANATSRSLVIMDEIGRGTSTYDGLAIAWSVLEHLARLGTACPYTLFATHYHELTQLAELSGVENYKLTIKETETGLLFLRRVVAGTADKSYGIHVAELAKLPPSVIVRAREQLRYFEQQGALTEHSTLTDTTAAAAQHELESELVEARAAQQQLVEFLKRLDIDRLTPLAALTHLQQLKQTLTANKPQTPSE